MTPTDIARGLRIAAKVLVDQGITQSQIELLTASIKLEPHEATLQQLLVAARTAHDIPTAAACADQLRPLVADDPDKQAWLSKAIRGSIHQYQLFRDLSIYNKQEPTYDPIPGRVMYVVHSSLPISSNGYSTRGQGVALGMLQNGIDLVCVTRPGFPFDLYPNDTPPYVVPAHSNVDGVVYHHVRNPTRKQYRKPEDYLLKAADALREQMRVHRPACVIAGSNHTNALPACLAAKALGIPFIYEVRGFWEITRLSREPDFSDTIQFKDQVFLETQTAQAADAVLTLTEAMQKLLVERGVAPEKIQLLPNSYDPSSFKINSRDDALASQYAIPDGIPVIGYIGSFVQYEGLENLTTACGILAEKGHDFRLLLVGSETAVGQDQGPITKSIHQIAHDGNFADKVILTGRVPHETVAAYYSLIDIAPFPRKPLPVTELVSPLKPIEALAMQKAVVVSSVSALAEMINDGDTGMIFDKEDPNALAHALEKLICDPDLRKKLGTRGQEWVQQHRSWQHTVAQSLTFLQQLKVFKEKSDT